MKRKNSIKNILIILFINVFLIGLFFFVANKIVPSVLKKVRTSYITQELAIFYRHHIQELHHLRDFDFLNRLPSEYKASITDYIYSRIGTKGSTILIQGDSWSEQFLTSESSSVLLSLFARENNSNFIVAGTTSYSPSVMDAQFRVLRQDFGINPEIVVATIDQTDFGDEVCRYKSLLSKNKQGNLVVLQNVSNKNLPYDLKPYFEFLDILDSGESPLVKLWRYSIKKFDKREDGGCTNDDILNPLRGQSSTEDEKYFIQRMAEYISAVLSEKGSVKHLVLVTFFHKNHVDGTYSVNVNKFIDEAIFLSGKQNQVTYLKFEKNDYDQSDLETMFKPGDLYSHLTNTAHGKFYTHRILKSLKPLLSNGL